MTILKTKYGSINVEFVHSEVVHVTTKHPLEYWKKLFHVDSYFDIRNGRVESRKSSFYDKTFGIYADNEFAEITIHQSKVISDEIVRTIDKYITSQIARIERKAFELQEVRLELVRLNNKYDELSNNLKHLKAKIKQRADLIRELEQNVAGYT